MFRLYEITNLTANQGACTSWVILNHQFVPNPHVFFCLYKKTNFNSHIFPTSFGISCGSDTVLTQGRDRTFVPNAPGLFYRYPYLPIPMLKLNISLPSTMCFRGVHNSPTFVLRSKTTTYPSSTCSVKRYFPHSWSIAFSTVLSRLERFILVSIMYLWPP